LQYLFQGLVCEDREFVAFKVQAKLSACQDQGIGELIYERAVRLGTR